MSGQVLEYHIKQKMLLNKLTGQRIIPNTIIFSVPIAKTNKGDIKNISKRLVKLLEKNIFTQSVIGDRIYFVCKFHNTNDFSRVREILEKKKIDIVAVYRK